MTEPTLAYTLINTGTAGAALIFTAYGLIIAFSDKLIDFKKNKIRNVRDKIEKNKTSSELKEIAEELEKAEAIPLYFSRIVLASFLLYLLSVLVSSFYLQNGNDKFLETAHIFFIFATIFFGIMGLSVLNDILEFMNFLIIQKSNSSNKKPKIGKGAKK